MNTTAKPDWKLALGIPTIIFISCFIITLTSQFKANPDLLSNAIILDLIITAPLIYFLAIRKSSVSKFTVMRVIIVGVLFAGLILNAESNDLLKFIKVWIAPLLEVFVIAFVVRKFYQTNRTAKLKGKKNFDFMIHCRRVMAEVIGNQKAGNMIASEIGTFYYAFFGRKDKSADSISKFTSYKKNGILLILGTILGIFLIETTGVHFLLSIWSNTFAWIITALSLYTCLQLFAHMKAIKARTTSINHNDSLEIYNGLAGDAIIKFDNVEKFEMTSKTPDREFVKLSLLRKLEKHNCVIYLKEPVQVTTLLGIIKTTDTVLFYVDDGLDFSIAMKAELQS